MKKQDSIQEKAKGILKIAKEHGTDNDPFFSTIYHSLLVQIDMLSGLEQSYREDGATITKEYVKGRENIYVHPAIDKYTKISDSARDKIIKLQEMIAKAKPTSDEEEENYF